MSFLEARNQERLLFLKRKSCLIIPFSFIFYYYYYFFFALFFEELVKSIVTDELRKVRS